MNNRFTFERSNIAEGYIEGRLEVSLEFRPGGSGKELIAAFCRSRAVIFVDNPRATAHRDERLSSYRVKLAETVEARRAPFHSVFEDCSWRNPSLAHQMLPCARSDHKCLAVPGREEAVYASRPHVHWNETDAMFVVAISVMEEPQQIVSSLVRPQLFDEIDRVDWNALFLFREGGLEAGEVSTERELQPRLAPLIETRV